MVGGGAGFRPKKSQAKCLTFHCSRALLGASTSVVTREHKDRSGGLQLAGGHFARLVVAFHLVADLLAFDDFAHAGPFDGGDVDEHVRTAVVRLNEAEALGGIEPFNCASGHDEPFRSNIEFPPRSCTVR